MNSFPSLLYLQDMCAFVDAAHEVGLGVMMDVVLHHGAPAGNNLWDYDGWSQDFNGGIYHENAPDTPWGRQFAFWKNEVRKGVVFWLRVLLAAL